MARFKFSPIMVDARGSVSDATFSVWKGVHYIRSRVTPANPRTANQVAQRDAMTTGVGLWQKLHASLVDAWKTYATGYNLSGYNAFIRRNVTTSTPSGDGTYPRVNHSCTEPLSLMIPSPGAYDFSTFSAIGGGSPGEIDVNFTFPMEFTPFALYVLVAQADTLLDSSTAKCIEELAPSPPVTVSGLESGESYDVFAIAYDTGQDMWSLEAMERNVTAG